MLQFVLNKIIDRMIDHDQYPSYSSDLSRTIMKIAVIGAGIAGLSCAYRLAGAGARISLFEAGSYFGGHTNTVDVEVAGQRFGVDTGFLVCNDRTYPTLRGLFLELDIPLAESDMSFSVQVPGTGAVEWAGTSLASLFAQRRNVLRPRFLGMVADILRFNREARALAAGAAADESLGQFLARRRFGTALRDWYLLPMAACIWSCPPRQMLDFPLATFVRFCDNHGLLQLTDRPRWLTVRGGARRYVERMLVRVPDRRLNCPVRALRPVAGGVQVDSARGTERFEQVVLACHPDQALQLLPAQWEHERALFGAIRYQPNRAVLHTDAALLPTRTRAWAAWNYEAHGGPDAAVCVHYLLNRLQPLPVATPVIVSLNPVRAPRPDRVLGTYDYAHPVFDAAAIAAQRDLPGIQGRERIWYAGAWTGYGFHEDGAVSGLAAAAAVLAQQRERHAA
jgi:predicted NAD/FAD-binding protein